MTEITPWSYSNKSTSIYKHLVNYHNILHQPARTHYSSSLFLIRLDPLTLRLRHPNQPVQQNRGAYVEDNVRPHNPKVSPSRAVARAHCRQEGVGATDGAQLATVGVHAARRQIAAGASDIIGHVCCARLSGWGIEE